LASFGLRADPTWAYADTKMPTYAASKAAVNALTVSYADQLKEKGIKVNAICPGYTATEATNFAGTRSPAQAAVIAVNMALIDDNGPSGTFCNDEGEQPW
jgi:NAD(P)-dependent dehydrogenase (short-subunit alcohol dehydrogenase family)